MLTPMTMQFTYIMRDCPATGIHRSPVPKATRNDPITTGIRVPWLLNNQMKIGMVGIIPIGAQFERR